MIYTASKPIPKFKQNIEKQSLTEINLILLLLIILYIFMYTIFKLVYKCMFYHTFQTDECLAILPPHIHVAFPHNPRLYNHQSFHICYLWILLYLYLYRYLTLHQRRFFQDIHI